jgi:hypothetical protein
MYGVEAEAPGWIAVHRDSRRCDVEIRGCDVETIVAVLRDLETA